jgi:hypothetical protein
MTRPALFPQRCHVYPIRGSGGVLKVQFDAFVRFEAAKNAITGQATPAAPPHFQTPSASSGHGIPKSLAPFLPVIEERGGEKRPVFERPIACLRS